MKLNFTKNICLAAALASAAILSSCQPDEFEGNGNGTTGNELDPAFTITQIDANHYRFDATETGAISNRWSVGDVEGENYQTGKVYKEVFLPDAGTYMVSHMVTGIGGSMYTTSQPLTVTTPDLVAGNLILGGKLNTAEDIAKWTVLNISPSNAAVDFADGKVTFTASGYAQKGIYQAVQVEAGKSYKIDLSVASNGVSNTWFEVYASPTAPVQGNDYSAGGMKLQISTWAGCGTSPFNGLLSVVGCGDFAHNNVVTFPDSGTVYLVIKCGGGANPGISADNIEMRRTQ